MNNCFKKLFHLQGLKVLDSRLEGKKMIVSCEPKRKEAYCPSCAKKIKTVHKYLKPRRIKHMFWQGNLIELDLKRRSFFCWYCKKKGLPWLAIENIPIIPKSKRYSLVYADQIMKGLGQTTFKTQQEIAETSFSTVQKLLSDRIDPFIGVWPKDTSIRSIGIDLHSFSGQTMLPTVCNLTDHRLITILPDNKQMTMREFLHNIPSNIKAKIEEVCIDMDCHYLKTIKEELPKARIVIDFFHVVSDANHRISETRTVIQKVNKVSLPKKLFEKNREHLSPNEWVELNNIFKAYPELGKLWRVKEQIRSIHKNPSTKLATILYGKLLKEMQLSTYPSVKQWAKTLNRWQNGILQYFEYHTTNGYTEGVNTKLKTIKRLSYGFRNIDNYIRKALLAFIPISLLLYHYI